MKRSQDIHNVWATGLLWVLWLDMKCPPKTCFVGLFPNAATFRSGVLGSDRIVKVLKSIGSWMDCWQVVETIGKWGVVGESRSFGVCPWGQYLVPDSFLSPSPPLSLSFLAAMSWAAVLHNALLPWYFCLGPSQSWAETSETMIHNKVSLFKLFTSDILGIVMKSWQIQVSSSSLSSSQSMLTWGVRDCVARPTRRESKVLSTKPQLSSQPEACINWKPGRSARTPGTFRIMQNRRTSGEPTILWDIIYCWFVSLFWVWFVMHQLSKWNSMKMLVETKSSTNIEKKASDSMSPPPDTHTQPGGHFFEAHTLGHDQS